MSSDKENISKPLDNGDEYIAALIFVHTRVQDRDITPCNSRKMKNALAQCFSTSSFVRSDDQDARSSDGKDGDSRPQYESYLSVLWTLRDQVLSMSPPSFSRTVSERDWLKNSAKIWELIKNSPIITDYCRTLQSSGFCGAISPMAFQLLRKTFCYGRIHNYPMSGIQICPPLLPIWLKERLSKNAEIIMDDFCNCGKNVVQRTSWTDLNPGRRYTTCNKFWEVGGCTYFSWVDSPMCARALQIIPGLLRRVNRLEADIRHKNLREKLVWVALVVSWSIMYLFKK
ncbi:protein smg9, partial [Phtheirospermum japonicum]